MKSHKIIFAGTILEITDNYFIVSPDDSEPIRETSDNILVPKEVSISEWDPGVGSW